MSSQRIGAAHQGAAFPPDEQARMRELLDLDILDTDAEDVFDDLTRLAAAICGTPMALISLVDHERQWFKSRVGLSTGETSRSSSFCAHAIQQPQTLFEVPDATGDSRFATNPLVLGDPNIRFYAGMPLGTGPTSAVGTICVLDHVPRQLSEFQQFALRTIAKAVSTHLDARRRRRLASIRDAVTGLPSSADFERTFAAVADPLVGGLCLVIGSARLTRMASAFGADVAETVLKEATQRLKSALPAPAQLAFLRRGLFAAFVPGAVDADEARQRCTTLQRRLTEVYRLDSPQAPEWFSCPWQIGIARFPRDGEDVLGLLGAAEEAMTRARENGQPIEHVSGVDRQAALDEFRLEGELRTAMRDGQFRTHYQPKIDIGSGSIVGLEALIRWQHPVRGLLLPGEFLPALEAADLAPELARLVIRQAAVDWTHWHRQGLTAPPIAVNIGAAQLYDAQIAGFIANALAVVPSRERVLAIEVTEGTLVGDPTRASQVLQRLRELGVSVAIDDFGTGYSSMAYLSSLPIDEIKIDRSFIATMEVDPAQRVLVETMILLARRLGRTIVAEGVETAAQHRTLLQLGCDQAQGWFYGRAIPPDDVATMLRASAPARRPARDPLID